MKNKIRIGYLILLNFLFFLVISSPFTFSSEVSTDFELGHQFSYRSVDDRITRNYLYFLPKAEYSDESYTLIGSVRGSWDKAWDMEVRELSGTLNRNQIKFQLGFQEVAWGETFGFYPADLVNPRDYSDPLITDLGWIRKPVFAFNSQIFLNRLTFQAVITPVPRQVEVPTRVRSVQLMIEKPEAFQLSDFGKDAEFGGKSSYLFESGLDLGLLYYRHWNRNPVYEVHLKNGELILIPIVNQVHSFGTTLSQSSESWVFRADSVLTLDQPKSTANFGPVQIANQWQTIFGTDWSMSQGITLGAQYHTDWTSGDFLNWISLRANYKSPSGSWEPEFFVFRGVNNSDFWVQPKLTWNMTFRTTLSIRADLLWGGVQMQDGVLGLFRDENRVLSWIAYKW